MEPRDEILRSHGGQGGSEIERRDLAAGGGGKLRDSPRARHEKRRGGLGVHHGERMVRKSQDRGARAGRGGGVAQRAQYPAVAEVDAVEKTYGDGGGARRRHLRTASGTDTTRAAKSIGSIVSTFS